MKERACFPLAGRIAVALLLMAAGGAAAQSTYPARTVRIIVPVTTGGNRRAKAPITGATIRPNRPATITEP